MTTISKSAIQGYRQVEPNNLRAPRRGGVFAQLPADESIEILEQGTFAKYDGAAGKVNFTGEGPWMMVYNEEKLYDERFQSHKDYAMKKADFYDGVMVPRLFEMVPGDTFTTNNLADGEYTVGTKVAPGADGILAAATGDVDGFCAVVTKEYTLPDGQPAVKLQVVSA